MPGGLTGPHSVSVATLGWRSAPLIAILLTDRSGSGRARLRIKRSGATALTRSREGGLNKGYDAEIAAVKRALPRSQRQFRGVLHVATPHRVGSIDRQQRQSITA
jgi:hypothetical protein